MSKIYYSGIGSRETPSDILSAFENIASVLSKAGFILRSGGAPGADTAFESGCNMSNGEKEIYLPWIGFNNNRSTIIGHNDSSISIVKKYIPYYDRLKIGAKKLLARNIPQILGSDLKSPSSFVVCYTEGGKIKGGTAVVLNVADDLGVTVFNAGSFSCIDSFYTEIENYISNNFNMEIKF